MTNDVTATQEILTCLYAEEVWPTSDTKFSVAEERGEERGIVKGERNKAIKASKKMLQDGLSFEFISKYLGLSIPELEQIQKSP